MRSPTRPKSAPDPDLGGNADPTLTNTHHGPATARQRAQDVVRIVKQHHVDLEEEQPYLCGGKTFCLLGCEPEADA